MGNRFESRFARRCGDGQTERNGVGGVRAITSEVGISPIAGQDQLPAAARPVGWSFVDDEFECESAVRQRADCTEREPELHEVTAVGDCTVAIAEFVRTQWRPM